MAKVLWRKKWILISIPIVAAGAAYFFTMDQVEYYRSKARIATGFTVNDQVQLTDEKFNLRDADVKFSNLLQSMKEAIPANLVAYRLMLHDLESDEPFRRPQNFNPAPETVEEMKAFFKRKLQTFSPLSTTDPEYNVARKFLSAYGYNYTSIAKGLEIGRVQNTDFVQIDFLSDNRDVSALAANAFCEEFIRYYKSLKSERTGESVEFLKKLMDEKKALLDEKLETQKMFKASNNLVDVEREGQSQLGQIQELERLRDDSRNKVQKLELTIQRLQEDIRNAGNSSPSTSTNNNAKIVELRERIARLNERYITGGSSNTVLLDSLNRLREQLRVQMENVNRQPTTSTSQVSVADLQSRLKDAEIDLKVERSNLSTLERKIANLRHMASGYANKEAALEAFQKEVDLASQEYLTAVDKYNEANNRLIASTTLRHVLLAAPAPYPESSKRYLIIALAGCASFAICVFAVVILELMDVSIRNPEKFKRIVGLPLVGMLNRIDNKNFNIRTYFNQTTPNEEAEMFKSLLRKLRHEIENSKAKVILFTSPKKKEGKTMTVMSLAYVLSLINKRVLVIDTNFKSNALSQMLVKPQTEIKVLEGKRVNLLIGSGKKENEEAGQAAEPDADGESSYELINPTRYKNIFIVGNAGGGSESPAEILSGRDFTNLIAVLVDSFDYILMEGAAMNDYSDTKELVQYSDKVFAVFSADSTIKQLDRDSIAYFKSLGKKFGGSILNKINTKDLKL